MGVPISEACGGLGGDTLSMRSSPRNSGAFPEASGCRMSPIRHLASKPIELFGTDEQKERWLTPLATGEHLGGWALTEPGSGSDASDMDTVAERDGDGYVIDGTKQFITNANVAGSVLVKAVTDPGAGYDGISTFIVDPEDDGFEVTTEWDKMGLNSSPTCELPSTTVGCPKTASSARRATAGSRR